MKWIFDGIGTQIVGIIVGLIIGTGGGGAIGYKIGIKRTLSQRQIAGDNSEQRQELQARKNDAFATSSKSKTTFKQFQKAGNGSSQTQIGGINDERR